MLVYQNDGDIFPVMREALECLFDRGRLGLVVYHEEISLRVRSVCYVLSSGVESVSFRMDLVGGLEYVRRCLLGEGL